MYTNGVIVNSFQDTHTHTLFGSSDILGNAKTISSKLNIHFILNPAFSSLNPFSFSLFYPNNQQNSDHTSDLKNAIIGDKDCHPKSF